MSIEWTIQGLSIPSSTPTPPEEAIFFADHHHTRIKIDPSRGLIACNGYPGHIQLYDIRNQVFAGSVEVVQYVRVSKTEKYTRIYAPSVALFEFSKVVHGSSTNYYLATIDVRRGEDIGSEYSLKVFQFQSNSEKYNQVAQMDRPHGKYKVIGLTMQQQVIGCVTSAVDGSIKMWRTSSTNNVSPDTELQWICLYTLKYRDCPANFTCFSHDNSLFALAHENMVSLWDPQRLSMMASFVSSYATKIIFVGFIEPCYARELGGGSGEAYLVLGSKKSLAVVDLLTKKTLWTLVGRFSAFAVAKNDSEACAVVENGWIACGMAPLDSVTMNPENEESNMDDHQLAIFSYSSDIPLMKRKCQTKISSIQYSSHSRGTEYSEASLVFLSKNGGLKLMYRGEEFEGKRKVARLHRTLLPQLPASLLQSSISSNQFNEVDTNFSAPPPNWLERYLDAETSNISSIASIYKDFMLNFLPKASASTQENSEEDEPVPWEITTGKVRDDRLFSDTLHYERMSRIRAAASSVFSGNETSTQSLSRSDLKSSDRAPRKRKEKTTSESATSADSVEPAKKRSSGRKKNALG